MTMTGESPELALLRRCFEAMRDGDFAVLEQTLAEDARWLAIDEEWGSCEGRATIVEVMSRNLAGRVRGSVEEAIQHGSRVLVAFRPERPSDAPDRPLENGIAYVVVTVEGGQIAELKGFLERAAALAYARTDGRGESPRGGRAERHDGASSTTAVAEPLASLDGVVKSYGAGSARQVVLDDLSLEIAAGELVVVHGPSGCGKTTLLNLLGGLDRADEGRIRSCGTELTGATRAELTAYRARSVGFIFQFYNLLPTLTALENVQAGVRVAGVERGEARERGEALLERVGLAELGGRFPAQLSGGQQQRVAIARALAKRPRLLLADEPTGNLDEETSAGVLELMRELNRDTAITFVIVSHNPAIARVGDRVVRLSHGRLAGERPPDGDSEAP